MVGHYFKPDGGPELEVTDDRRLKRRLHILRPRDRGSRASVDAFLQRARLLAALDHPNVLPILELGQDDRGPFFVTPARYGTSLREILVRASAGERQSFGLEGRLDVFAGVVRALGAAHRAGIVHLAVHPANVWVGRDLSVRLDGWEHAQPLGWTPNAIPTTWSPYAAPEEWAGFPCGADARADLFGACAILATLLGLRFPIDPRELNAWTRRHTTRGPVPLELLALLQRGLAQAPAKRFQSAEDLLLALEHARQGRCPIRSPVALLKRTTTIGWRMVERHIAAFNVAITALLIASGLFAGVLLLYRARFLAG